MMSFMSESLFKIWPKNKIVFIKLKTQDFQSENELANHLKYLNNNTTAYAEYFEWKNYFNVSFSYNQPFCQVL